MIEHFNLGWMLLIVGLGVFVIAWVINTFFAEQWDKLEQWDRRHQELMQQWQAAKDSHNYNECERLCDLMRENWESYRRNE